MIDLKVVRQFVNQNIGSFHQARLVSLQDVSPSSVPKRKNPYLFRAKNLNTASELVESLLMAYLSSSEEEAFGQFLEKLALFVAEQTKWGFKSKMKGIDLELNLNSTHYVVQIKSGPNWGNASQKRELKTSFAEAMGHLKCSGHSKVDAVLGICYGKAKPKHLHNYQKLEGQSFWHFLSGEINLYTEIIEPLGYRAKQHNEAYEQERVKAFNRFTKEFLEKFCGKDGSINWEQLVQFNSGNGAWR